MLWTGSRARQNAAAICARKGAAGAPVLSPAMPSPSPAAPPPRALETLARDLSAPSAGPPAHWNPPFCGDVDIRVRADGTWLHLGSPIRRPALVKLFAGVMRREGADYVLVTPVEKLRIAVDDAPFAGVELRVSREGDARALDLRTNVDEWIALGPDRPLRFSRGPSGGLKPYALVRPGLEALLARALLFELADLAETRGAGAAIVSRGAVFAMEAA